jgi:hypothetical protein
MHLDHQLTQCYKSHILLLFLKARLDIFSEERKTKPGKGGNSEERKIKTRKGRQLRREKIKTR